MLETVGRTSVSWWRYPVSETGQPAIFVPYVAKQHDVSLLRFAGAIAFGVLVSARASLCLDKMNLLIPVRTHVVEFEGGSKYSELSLRRTPSGPALALRLKELSAL